MKSNRTEVIKQCVKHTIDVYQRSDHSSSAMVYETIYILNMFFTRKQQKGPVRFPYHVTMKMC